MKDVKKIIDTYSLPEYKLRELEHKKKLIESAELILNHGLGCDGGQIVLLVRDVKGNPLILQDNGKGVLTSMLEFEYED